MADDNRNKDVDKLLKRLFNENEILKTFPLKDLFEQRIHYLSITKHQACKILGIEHKTLDSILEGDSKKIDFVSILKLSDFLEISHSELIEKYFDLVIDTHNESIELAKKRNFIVNNFDLPKLKKIGFIDSINNFEEIENRINTFFGYDSIFEYGKNRVTTVFSSAKRKTNQKNLDFWWEVVDKNMEKTPNPYEYDREELVEYFPKIRWHCMDVKKGLLAVAQQLFKLGITLIIVPKFTSDIHIRAATFNHREKPCIALTKYTKFYPTLWFSLIHELYHVLYDWDIIRQKKCHFTTEAMPVDGESKSNVGGAVEIGDLIEINEDEADDFARQYLFPDKKMEAILPYINDPLYVERFAKQNHVHKSFIYVFYLWDRGNSKSYAKFNKYFPKAEFDELLENFRFEDYLKYDTVKNITRKRNINLNYNTL